MTWLEKLTGKRWLIPSLGLIIVGAAAGAYFFVSPILRYPGAGSVNANCDRPAG